MKKMFVLFSLIMGFVVTPAYAEQTVSEKVEVKAKDAKRSVKKGTHRVKETFCMKGDAECLAQKSKHRAVEVKDSVKDKGSEIKDRVD